MRIDEIGRHQIVGADGRGIAHGERRVLQGPLDRPPQVDHLHAALQQFVGLVGQQVAHALRARTCGVVDMHALHRLARRVAAILGAGHAAAHGVVEDVNAVGPGRLLQNSLDFRVVDAAHLLVVEEVAHGALVVHQGKAVGIERHLTGNRPCVMDRHLVRFVVRIAARHPRRRLKGIVARPLGHRHEVVHVGLDARQAGDDVGLQAHGHDLRTGIASRDVGSGGTARHGEEMRAS